MSKKRLIGWLQNLLLILLTASALYLLTMIPGSNWRSHFQTLLTSHPQEVASDNSSGFISAIPAFHLMATADMEYGRYGLLSVSPQDQQILQLMPLLQDSLGSAAESGQADDAQLKKALESPGFLLDLMTEIPLSVIADWLDADITFDRPVRRIALIAEGSDNAVLYLQDADGSITRYHTALSVSAVQEQAAAFSPNGSRFGYESTYSTLSPYAFLINQTPELSQVNTAVPAGFTEDSLLAALGFNIHNRYRYQESSGTKVIIESPRELRISPNASVSYTGDSTAASPLYHIVSAGDAPTAAEAVQAAAQLSATLSEATGASPMVLHSIEATETGFDIFFRYQHNSYPVYCTTSDSAMKDGSVLRVTITDTAITAFTFHCRSYTDTDQFSLLLPSTQAVAVASIYPGSELFIGYTDQGQNPLSPAWRTK